MSAAWTVNGQSADFAEFTNVYAPDAATLSIPVQKVITGHEVTVDKTFRFTLTPDDEEPMPATDTVSILGTESSAFGVITFTSTGIYKYTVSEIDDGEPGYTYDATTYHVVVTVSDQGGTLSAS